MAIDRGSKGQDLTRPKTEKEKREERLKKGGQPSSTRKKPPRPTPPPSRYEPPPQLPPLPPEPGTPPPQEPRGRRGGPREPNPSQVGSVPPGGPLTPQARAGIGQVSSGGTRVPAPTPTRTPSYSGPDAVGQLPRATTAPGYPSTPQPPPRPPAQPKPSTPGVLPMPVPSTGLGKVTAGGSVIPSGRLPGYQEPGNRGPSWDQPEKKETTGYLPDASMPISQLPPLPLGPFAPLVDPNARPGPYKVGPDQSPNYVYEGLTDIPKLPQEPALPKPPAAAPQAGRDAEAARLQGLADEYQGPTPPQGAEVLPPNGPAREIVGAIPWTQLGMGSVGEGSAWSQQYKQTFGVWPWEGDGDPADNLGIALAQYPPGSVPAGGVGLMGGGNYIYGDPRFLPPPPLPTEGMYPPYGPQPAEEESVGFGYGGGGGGWGGYGGGGGGYGGGGRGYAQRYPVDPRYYIDQQRGI